MLSKSMIVLAAFALVLLGGCGDDADATRAEAKTNSNLDGISLMLPSGTQLLIRGSAIKEYSRNSGAGSVKHYEITSNSVAKIFENNIYAQLKRDGYQRSVIDNTATQYKVHYKKPGYSTIGAIYFENTSERNASSKLKIYWDEI